jgi:hypothetical protein
VKAKKEEKREDEEEKEEGKRENEEEGWLNPHLRATPTAIVFFLLILKNLPICKNTKPPKNVE